MFKRRSTVIYNTIIISKLDLEKCLSIVRLLFVDVSSIFCRLFVYFLSIFAWFSFDILSIFCPYCVRLIARVHRSQIKPALCLWIRQPTSGPTYCIVPLILSGLNVIIWNRTYTVIYNTIIMSKLDLEKCVFVFCRFCVDVSSVFC